MSYRWIQRSEIMHVSAGTECRFDVDSLFVDSVGEAG
jgi:hypothetical protein